MLRLYRLPPLFTTSFPWAAWEALLDRHGYTLDRPRGAAHPHYPEIRYPLDYGYVNGTTSGDGDAVDVFVGTARTGLVGAIITHDKRKGDCEVKLLWHCAPAEIYTALGFLNFAPEKLVGHVAMRMPMGDVWARVESEEGKG